MNERVVTDEVFALIREKLESGGNVSFTVTGNSMHPYFHDREDTVTLCPVSGKIKKNSIVFYRRENGSYVLHRVIKIKGETVYCRGDNQFSSPEPVMSGDVMGYAASYTVRGKTYTDRSVRSVAVLFYVKAFYCFRKLSRKVKKVFFSEKK